MNRLGNRYQLLEKLGEGGEGQVWSALDSWSDDRPVAIKRLSSSGSESVQREFSALGYLRHPHIVSALDLVHDDTGTYLVEQRVFGDTLDQWVREVSLETVFEEMAPVFHALAHLHARGWVHLDPTAANILVERSPSRAVLIDLGLVQPLGASVIAGTPRFIAPELLTGEAVSPAADVYTLALSLWELLKSRVDGESSAHRDIRASFELGFHQDPTLRPGAYRFAQMLLELAGSGNGALLSRPVADLPLCGRADAKGAFAAWVGGEGPALRVTGAAGCGATAFLEYCASEFKLANRLVISLSAEGGNGITELLFQAISGVSRESSWLKKHGPLLKCLVEHPRLESFSTLGASRYSIEERAHTAALLVNELSTLVPLGVIVHDISGGVAGTEWEPLIAVWSQASTASGLKVILETSEHPDVTIRPLSAEGVNELLFLACARPPSEAEVTHLLELTGGRPKLLVEGLKICARDDKALMSLRAVDWENSGEHNPLADSLKPMVLARGAVPSSVVHSLLKVGGGSVSDLWDAIDRGWMTPMGKQDELTYSVPKLHCDLATTTHGLDALRAAYEAAGYPFEARLLSLRAAPHSVNEASITDLLERSPEGCYTQVFQELYEVCGGEGLSVENWRLWAEIASEEGDVTSCHIATEALLGAEDPGWCAARLGRALNRNGEHAEALALVKGFSERDDCLSIQARALLSQGKASDVVDLLDGIALDHPEMCSTLGSAQCVMGRWDEGVKTLQRAVELAEGSDLSWLLGRSLHGLAIAYQRSGRADDALQAYQDSLRHSNHLTSISRSLNYGTLLQDLGYWAEAERRFRECFAAALTLGNLREQARIGVNLSNLLVISGQLEEGWRLAEWTATLCGENNLDYPRAMALLVMAEARLEKNDALHATAPLEKAREILSTLSDPSADAEWTLLDARAALVRGDEEHLNECFERLSEESHYAELRWRIALWRTHARLSFNQAVSEVERDALRRSLRECSAENNLRFMWKLNALKGLLEAPAGLVTGSEIRAETQELVQQWRERLSLEQRRTYFSTIFRKQLLSSLNEETTKQVAPMTEQPQISFIRKLVAINRRLAREHDVDALLELIVDSAIELVGAERGFVLLKTYEGVDVCVARNLDRASIAEGSHGISRSIAMEVLTTGERVLTTNALEDARFQHARSVSAFRLRSVLCLPLRESRSGEDSLVGSLYLDNRLQERAFSEGDMELCAALADQASIALENARLISQIRSQEGTLENQNQQLETLNQALRREVALYAAQAEEALKRLREEGPTVGVGAGFEKFVGKSETLKGALRLVERFADTDVPVLIRGESGTGKELVAQALHQRSRRRERAFVSINCGAIPHELIESELFGYRKGAFTGALKDKKGLIQEAEGGTLFLDEIGEMSVPMQVKLLRVLQENEFRPVGSNESVSFDVRFLSATHRDLPKLIEDGLFREDFYYRIQVVEIGLPPLRDRREDIPALVDYFSAEMAKRSAKESFSKEAIALLMAYDWPGNIRELENEIRRCLALADDVVGGMDLSEKLQRVRQGRRATLVDGSRGTLKEIMDRFEREVLNASLQRNGWNVRKTASDLGLSRASLYTRLSRFEIKRAEVN